MNKTLIYSLIAGITSLATGYLTGGLIFSSRGESSGVSVSSVSSAKMQDKPDNTSNQIPNSVPAGSSNVITRDIDQAPKIESISTPVADKTGQNFSFTVKASGQDLSYWLLDENQSRVISGPNKSAYYYVSASTSGIYYVYVTDINGNKSEIKRVSGCKIVKVDKVTVQELSQILNSRSGWESIKSRVSPGLHFTFDGLSDDESTPASYLEIFNRLNMGSWSSVDVLSVNYSANGLLTSARIKVNY